MKEKAIVSITLRLTKEKMLRISASMIIALAIAVWIALDVKSATCILPISLAATIAFSLSDDAFQFGLFFYFILVVRLLFTA